MPANEKELNFLLKIDKELWEKFKSKVTRDITLNDMIVELIKKFVEEGS